jgi:hypothetical protein
MKTQLDPICIDSPLVIVMVVFVFVVFFLGGALLAVLFHKQQRK